MLFKEDGIKIFNACGKFSLNQSAALVKNSIRVITHDTGLMHIAAAFKKDIISVWGNTVPEFGMYPYTSDIRRPMSDVRREVWDVGRGTSNVLEVNGLPCRPCSKIGFEKCPKGHFKCMNQIDEKVFEGL